MRRLSAAEHGMTLFMRLGDDVCVPCPLWKETMTVLAERRTPGPGEDAPVAVSVVR